MTWKPKHLGQLAGALGGLFCMQLVHAQSVDRVYEQGGQRILQAQADQDEIDAIVDATEDDFEAYQVLLREIEDLEVYNNLLEAQVNAQRRTLDQLYTSIDEVSFIERQILPLMTRMVAGLERFIELDAPFLLDERMERVQTAKDTLRRSDVSAAEQFRFVTDAWLIEMNDYGTQGDIYIDEIVDPNNITREVEILRIGRVALLYIAPDDSQAGVWDREAGEWVLVDEDLIEDIRTGIEAYRTGQPALFVVPVAPPEEG